jgi:hypothetical protein
MPIGSRRTRLVAGATIAWLIGVSWATVGNGMSTRAVATAAAGHVNANAERGVFQPSCQTPNAYAQAGAQAASPARPQTSEEAFKNVQVLKGIPVDEFMGTMGIFSAALGMCCLECHVPDWAADSPRKITARKMIQMTETINRANFSGRKVVTCWTCHRQSDRPSVTPLLDVVYGEPIYYAPDDFFQQTPGAPKPDEVLDKYIQAVGGAERVSRLTSFVGKGKAAGFGGASSGAPVELYAKAPNQRTVIQHLEVGNKTTTYDVAPDGLRRRSRRCVVMTSRRRTEEPAGRGIGLPDALGRSWVNGVPTCPRRSPTARSSLLQGTALAEQWPRARRGVGPVDARRALCQLGDGPRADADRFRRLSRRCRGRDRSSGRLPAVGSGCHRAERRAGECPD